MCNVRTVFINEVDNDPASKALEVVQTFLRKNSNYGLSLQIDKVEIGQTSAQQDIEKSLYKYVKCLYFFKKKKKTAF